MEGKGKYNDACALVRQATEGDLVAVIVFNGNRGSGFSVQTTSKALIQHLPELLEFMASEIRAGK